MQRLRNVVALAALVLVSLSVAAPARATDAGQPEPAFNAIARVLMSPRCLNCHTVTDFPRQGDDRHPHIMNVGRGADNHGAPALRCSTCHTTMNQTGSGVPGAPNWGLAPLSMGWEGLSPHDLCVAVKDPAKNGNRSVSDLVSHMTGDALVQWAWNPGEGRTTPPIGQKEFHGLVRSWAAQGAPCP